MTQPHSSQKNKNQWRLILSKFTDGAANMALDESLLLSTARKEQPATLRIYGWEPATLSLGFAQSTEEIDLDHIKDLGWGIVRRPTGGRAILHVDELTYSLTASIDEPGLSGNLLDTYHQISRAILNALAILGVQANNEKKYATAESKDPAPVCFETPSNYEITANGKKLFGSAQARKYNGLLQHGSLPVYGELTRINRVIKFRNDQDRHKADERLLTRATTLQDVVGKEIPYESVQQAFIQGFAEIFNIDWIASQPTEKELSLAADLVRTKYAADSWTFRI